MKRYVLNKAQIETAQRLSGRDVPYHTLLENRMLVTTGFAVVNMTMIPMDIVPEILKAKFTSSSVGFKVGDIVEVLDGSFLPDVNNLNWVPAMGDFIGETTTIAGIKEDYIHLDCDRSKWSWDSNWIKKVSI